MSEKLYRIEWENTDTGTTGHGYPVSKEVAEFWVEIANNEHPQIKHKAVKIK